MLLLLLLVLLLLVLRLVVCRHEVVGVRREVHARRVALEGLLRLHGRIRTVLRRRRGRGGRELVRGRGVGVCVLRLRLRLRGLSDGAPRLRGVLLGRVRLCGGAEVGLCDVDFVRGAHGAGADTEGGGAGGG